jgi:hypothetical protein
MPERLAQHLISRGLLPASKVDSALRQQQANKGGLDSALLEQGLVSEAGLLQALSDVSGLQPVNLADFEPNTEAAAQLPRKIAERLTIAPLSIDGATLHLAVCYPAPKDALKEVSFLLGKKLELWVALEARVHDWNASVYATPLAPRFERLLRQLDPNRRGKSGQHQHVEQMTELITDDVLRRGAGRGTPEEPILLEKPKNKRKPTLEVLPDAHGEQDTVFINVAAYQALDKEKKKQKGLVVVDDDEREETSVLDLDRYADFARKATNTAASDPNLPSVKARPPPAVTPAVSSQWDDTTSTGEPEPQKGAFRFPGGVLPPRTKKDEKPQPPRPSAPVERITAAPAPRPRISAARPELKVLSLDEEVTRREVVPKGPTPVTPQDLTDFAKAARMPMPPAALELKEPNQPAPSPQVTAPVVTPAPLAPRDETDFSDIASSPGSLGPPPVPSVPPPVQQLVQSDPMPSPPLIDATLASGPNPVPTDAAVRTDELPPVPHPDAPLRVNLTPSDSDVASIHSEVTPLPVATAPMGLDEPSVPAPPPSVEPPADPQAWQQQQAAWNSEGQGGLAMPSPEEWASLTPEQQAAWWEQYNAIYGQEQWPPNSEASAEGWVTTDPQGVPAVSADEAPLPPDAAGPDKLPPEDDTWVAVPPSARPLADGHIPPPPPPASAPPPPPPRPTLKFPDSPQEWSLPLARTLLKSATQDRELLFEVALRFAQRAFDFCAAFAVVRGVAVGWTARGEGDDEMMRQVAVPLDVASVFRTVAMTRGSYIGPLPNDALTQHYLAMMGRAPRTLFVWPLEVKGRLVALLYGDCGSKPVSQRKLSDFMLFCQDLPGALNELLVYRKTRTGQSQAFTAQESGDARPAGIADAETVTNVPVVSDESFDEGVVRDLLGLLTGPDANDRATAMTELMKTPDASARALSQAFPGPTAWSRLPVVELPEADELGPIPGALARLGRAGALALAPLLDSNDSDVRYLALLTAGSLHYPELVDGVMRGLFDVEPDISSAARAAASGFKGLLKFDAGIPDLRRELIARDPMNRSLAARALGVLRDRDAVSGLIDLVDDADELCAQAAVESLREITRQNFGPDRDAWNRWWEVSQGRRRIEWLVEALDSPDFDARLAAIDELTRAQGDNLGYFADGAEQERYEAAQKWRALLEIKPELEV